LNAPRLRTIRHFALAFAALTALHTAGYTASPLPSGCDDIQTNAHPRIAPNSTVLLVVPADMPQEYAAGLSAAIGALNGKVNGINFTQGTTDSEDVASITVSIGGADVSNMGIYSGSAGSNGYLRAGNLHVFPDTRGCGDSASSLCLDPSSPSDYLAAIQAIFLHELLHALGADHSQKANVMYSSFWGVNNTANPNPNLDCVTNQLRTLISVSTPPPPNTCS